MEGLYQNNLYSSAASYVLPSAHTDSSFGNNYHSQYRVSAFSDTRYPNPYTSLGPHSTTSSSGQSSSHYTPPLLSHHNPSGIHSHHSQSHDPYSASSPASASSLSPPSLTAHTHSHNTPNTLNTLSTLNSFSSLNSFNTNSLSLSLSNHNTIQSASQSQSQATTASSSALSLSLSLSSAQQPSIAAAGSVAPSALTLSSSTAPAPAPATTTTTTTTTTTKTKKSSSALALSTPISSSAPITSTAASASNGFGWPSSSAFSWNSGAPLGLSSSSLARPFSYGSSCYGSCPAASSGISHITSLSGPPHRPKLTTTMWEDENTACYQVDTKSVCVARRQDNDMVNGTKLLNVVGMSRGKRDGILKNEKGRVVVKVGAMHLKGVWITFSRAKDLATKFKILDLLYPLFVDDPSVFLYSSTAQNSNGNLPLGVSSSCDTSRTTNSHQLHSYKSGATTSYTQFPLQSWDRTYQSLPSITNTNMQTQQSQNQQSQTQTQSQNQNQSQNQSQQQDSFRSQANATSGSCSPVPGTTSSMLAEDNDLYLMNNSYEYRTSGHRNSYSSIGSSGHAYGSHNNNNNNGLGVPGIYSSASGHHDSHSYSTQHYGTSGFGNRKSHYYSTKKSRPNSLINDGDNESDSGDCNSDCNNESDEKDYMTTCHQSTTNEPADDTKSLGSGQIDFPSSPPPESSGSGSGSQVKLTPYSHTSSSSTTVNNPGNGNNGNVNGSGSTTPTPHMSGSHNSGSIQTTPSFSSTWSASFGSLNPTGSEVVNSKATLSSNSVQGRAEGVLPYRQPFDGKIGSEGGVGEKTAVAGMVKANRKQSMKTDDHFKPSKSSAGRKRFKGEKGERV